jgi:PST family polysaccharide transporter
MRESSGSGAVPSRDTVAADVHEAGEAEATDHANLRRSSASGSLYLMAREVVGLVLRFGGLLVLTRLLGPDRYGVYAGAVALIVIPVFAAQLATETYLIRMPTEPSKQVYDEAFTLLMLSSVVVVAVTLGITVAFPGILADERMLHAFQAMMISVPFNVVWAPAQAQLERAFQYRKLAMLELSGDVVLYTIAVVGVVVFHLGYWGPVIGLIIWQIWLLLGSLGLAHYRPALRLSRAGAREHLSYGVRYVVSVSTLIARGSLNPLIVGQYAGTAAVGAVALATQLVEALSAFSRVVWRTGAVAIGRLQNDARRLALAVEENISVVMIAMGTAMALFIGFAPLLVEFVFGPRWKPVIPLLPYLCAAALVWAAGSVFVIVMTTKLRMGPVAVAQALRIGLVVATAPGLMHAADLRGYALAECVSALAALVLCWALHRELPELRQRFLIPLLVVFVPPLFWHEVPALLRPLLVAPAVIALLVPAVRARLGGYLALFTELVARRRARGAEGSTATPEAPVAELPAGQPISG